MRKRLLSFVLCAAMALTAMTGCGAKTEDTEASSKGAETGSEAAKAGEEETEAAREADGEEKGLVIPSASCVANLNPLLESYKEGVIMLNPLYDPLYVIDVNETRYYLAESYEVSEDGTSVTLKLKDGLKWHDGEPITADDVIFTMDVNADTNNGAGNTNVVILNDQPVKYEKVDDLTVKITLPMASASYPALLGELTLIPEHVYGGNTSIVGAEANMSGIGSGPYKLREFKQDQYLILEKNEDYYMGAPDIDTVTFRIISDISAQEVALMNGEINLMELSSAPAVAKYSEDPNYTVVMYPEGRVNYLAVNKFCETVQDPKVVEAVFAALDAQEIIDGAYGEGMAVPANTVLSNMTTFYDESVEGYSQDIEKAKQLAAETRHRGVNHDALFQLRARLYEGICPGDPAAAQERGHKSGSNSS